MRSGVPATRTLSASCACGPGVELPVQLVPHPPWVTVYVRPLTVTWPTRLAAVITFVTARIFAEPLPAAGAGVVLRTISQSLSLVAVHAHAAGAVTLMLQFASPCPTLSVVLSSAMVQTGSTAWAVGAQLAPQPLCD